MIIRKEGTPSNPVPDLALQGGRGVSALGEGGECAMRTDQF